MCLFWIARFSHECPSSLCLLADGGNIRGRVLVTDTYISNWHMFCSATLRACRIDFPKPSLALSRLLCLYFTSVAGEEIAMYAFPPRPPKKKMLKGWHAIPFHCQMSSLCAAWTPKQSVSLHVLSKTWLPFLAGCVTVSIEWCLLFTDKGREKEEIRIHKRERVASKQGATPTL